MGYKAATKQEENVTVYHDHDCGGTLADGSEFKTENGEVTVPESAAALLCETFGFRRTKEKPVKAATVNDKVDSHSSELEQLKQRLAELEAKSEPKKK